MNNEGLISTLCDLLIAARIRQGRHDTKVSREADKVDELVEAVGRPGCEGIKVVSSKLGGDDLVVITPLMESWPDEKDPSLTLRVEAQSPERRTWAHISAIMDAKAGGTGFMRTMRINLCGDLRTSLLESYTVGRDLAAI